jgi:HSP20 family protein
VPNIKEAKNMFGLTPFNRNAVRRVDEQDKFYNLLDDFFTDSFMPFRSLRTDTFKIDVKDEGKHFVIEADLPGIKKEEISLNYQDGYLMIEVVKNEEKEEENKQYIHRERRQSSMKRTIHLGELNAEGVEARLNDGILVITAPKMDSIETKTKISIK